MDVAKINTSLKDLKEQLKRLMSASADLIEKNSLIDSGENYDPNILSKPVPKFETLLEDFLSTCTNIELNLTTLKEYIQLGKATNHNLPVTVSATKSDSTTQNPNSRLEPIEPYSTISYNQYLSAIKFQVDTANSIRAILTEFVNKQSVNTW